MKGDSGAAGLAGKWTWPSSEKTYLKGLKRVQICGFPGFLSGLPSEGYVMYGV
jgi:hypothetical protein